MTDLVFVTGGDWDSTTLHNNGFELAAQQLMLEIRAGRDEFDEPMAKYSGKRLNTACPCDGQCSPGRVCHPGPWRGGMN